MGLFARVSRPKLAGPGRHEAVLLPNGLVAHTLQDNRPHVTSFEDYRKGREVLVEDTLQPHEVPAASARLQQLLDLGEPYDPLFSNCESFARKVMRGVGVSWQAVVLTGLVGAGVWWIAKNGHLKPA